MNEMPKNRETVTIQLTGIADAFDAQEGFFRVRDETGDNFAWVKIENIVQPQQPWDVLRAAADLVDIRRYPLGVALRELALEAERATPKPPPTLAEAAKKLLDAMRNTPVCEKMGDALIALEDALAREEAKD